MATSITRPMLAGKIDDASKLRFPLLASPKIDGIRCLILDGQVLSRSLKPIPNAYIVKKLRKLPNGLDGELLVGATFQECTSAVMSRDGEPMFQFHVFDFVQNGDLTQPFEGRVLALRQWHLHENVLKRTVRPVEQRLINDAAELAEYEERCVAMGYEGVMLRLPDGPYKCGRSTFKEHYLLKLKRFEDAEAEIIGFVEMLHNANAATTSELGLTKRSSHKANMKPMGTLGVFQVRDTKTGVEFDIGTGEGLTQELRKAIWDRRKAYMGKLIKYVHQPHGRKDKPRLPVFKGFRDPRDM